ncbi:MAG: transposase, partial [Kiritimatiellae bacterium]|nr:transposase [Kiritimatiellia bacterium]
MIVHYMTDCPLLKGCRRQNKSKIKQIHSKKAVHYTPDCIVHYTPDSVVYYTPKYSAINEVCPNAIQIADRFHLLMNLSDALDAYFKSIRRRINSLITAKTNEFLELPAKETLTINEKEEDDQPDLTVQETIAAKVDPRMDTFLKVKELQSKGTPIKRIAVDLKMSRNTVKSYFNQEILSPIKSSRSTNIEVYTDLIIARLNENGYKLIDIFREIKELGYNGGRTQGCVNIKRI